MRKQMKFIIHIPPTILRSYCDHIEIYREHCHYKIIPKKATLKHFPGRLQVSSTSFVSSSCISSPSTCQSQTGGAGVGSLANTVARAPDDLTTARNRRCWRVCARMKMAIRLVFCCHDRLRGQQECARLQTGVPINTRDCLAGASRRKASRRIRQASRRQNPTACNSPRSTSHSRTLAHALPPLPPTFDSSTDPARQQVCRLARLASHYCCKPRLPKVRLSIRGVLNPYILPPPAPDIVPRCTAPSPYGPDCLAAAG